ncbi:MAG: hypothetical protein FIB03_02545 [Anaerolineae bacterium]|nr:hypothetical protein [Anaerolineae bacterium]
MVRVVRSLGSSIVERLMDESIHRRAANLQDRQNCETNKPTNEETIMGLYFEEFTVGQKIVTEKRVIAEQDIMDFARLSGDDNRLHPDPEFS